MLMSTVGPVNRRTFGSFVEHLGRCVYTGIYEPDHPRADSAGFRRDVLELVRDLGVTAVRYPGGNFVSGYRWEDGIGPVDRRPRRLDLAWHSTEPNTVGVDEFMGWAASAQVEPMMTVNLGSCGPQAALDLLEYCNSSAGTYWSDARRSNGHADPYDVRMWCLGNEMDGPWQIGAKTACEYGRLASQTAKAMRMLDPSLELVACGSSRSSMPTFGAWEREVLAEAYGDDDLVRRVERLVHGRGGFEGSPRERLARRATVVGGPLLGGGRGGGRRIADHPAAPLDRQGHLVHGLDQARSAPERAPDREVTGDGTIP